MDNELAVIAESTLEGKAWMLDGVVEGLSSNQLPFAPGVIPSSDTPAEGLAPALRVMAFEDLLKARFPARELLLDPIITTQSINMLHAWRGIGKTHVGLGIAYAVASGGAFLKWKAAKPRAVLYLDGEMPGYSLQERLQQIQESNDKDPPDGFFKILTPDLQEPGNMPDLSTLEGQAAVERILTPDISLIVVDNISCLCRTGRENEAESWNLVQAWALRQRAAGRAVLFIHHSGKNGEQRGASKREDILDTVIKLKRPADYESTQGARFEVVFEKARNITGEDTEGFEAHLATSASTGMQGWVYTDLAKTNFDKVVELSNEGLSQSEIANELQLNRSTVNRNYRKAREMGLITIPEKK